MEVIAVISGAEAAERLSDAVQSKLPYDGHVQPITDKEFQGHELGKLNFIEMAMLWNISYREMNLMKLFNSCGHSTEYS